MLLSLLLSSEAESVIWCAGGAIAQLLKHGLPAVSVWQHVRMSDVSHGTCQ